MHLRKRDIRSARRLIGALLLFAAVLTWAIGLTLNPHGKSAAYGVDYLSSTIVTFKRHGAIGTLILCALVAWLLFPQRPKWLARDWSLFALLALLGGSSVYTLIWLWPPSPQSVQGDDNLAANADSNLVAAAPSMSASTMTGLPRLELKQSAGGAAIPVATNEPARMDKPLQSAEPDDTDEPTNDVVEDSGAQPTNDETAANPDQ